MKLGIVLSAMTLLFSLNIVLTFATPTPANESFPPKWELLGSRKVNYGLDRDEIIVTRAEGVFSALKLKVRKGGINLHKVAVHFGNGEVEELEVRANIPADGETRVLDLPGNKRIIQKVVFWYDTKNHANQKAHVDLWGRN